MNDLLVMAQIAGRRCAFRAQGLRVRRGCNLSVIVVAVTVTVTVTDGSFAFVNDVVVERIAVDIRIKTT